MLKLNLKFSLLLAWYYGFRTIKRGPSYVIASLSSPLTLLFLVYIISRGELVRFAIAGGFIGLVASVALSSSGDAAFLRLQLRIQDLYVASRVTPSDYMVGLTLSYLIFSIPGIVLYVILGYFYHIFTPLSSIYLAMILVLLVISTSSISFIISGSISHVRNVWGIAGILSIIMTVLPPTFYPYTYIPKVALYALFISPATSAAVLVQGIFGLEALYLPALYIIIGETAIYFAVARLLTRWREN
ncbi:MAG: ABC transporter permease [Candidatus Thermoplasmatota archaeon]|nr:ABC transporter permease [Candidatus Thermoplasmatota archaeon]MCL5665924.1 ABC transporter permease [Candidatus Thermoplasmatota archaeon]